MTEEEGCTTCGIEPRPEPREEETFATQAPEMEEQEEIKIPEKVKQSGMLGLLTGACLLTDEDKREDCWKGIEPLEENKETPEETVKRIIAMEGVDNVKKTMNALQALIDEAEKELENRT